MIPVLICPVVNQVELLRRMIASIDEPVGRLVVVDMTPEQTVHIDHHVPEAADSPDVLYIRPLISVGYPGAINAGIMQTPDAPWWMFTSHDLVWGAGDLAEITALIEMDPQPAFVTGDRSDDRMLRHAYGAVNVATIQAIGLMDEHAFYPVYFDDDDWERRCHLGGVEWVVYNGNIAHDRSSTIKDPEKGAGNARTFPLNHQAYIDKWGGNVGGERYLTPYNIPNCPLSYTRPDPAARAARKW